MKKGQRPSRHIRHLGRRNIPKWINKNIVKKVKFIKVKRGAGPANYVYRPDKEAPLNYEEYFEKKRREEEIQKKIEEQKKEAKKEALEAKERDQKIKAKIEELKQKSKAGEYGAQEKMKALIDIRKKGVLEEKALRKEKFKVFTPAESGTIMQRERENKSETKFFDKAGKEANREPIDSNKVRIVRDIMEKPEKKEWQGQKSEFSKEYLVKLDNEIARKEREKERITSELKDKMDKIETEYGLSEREILSAVDPSVESLMQAAKKERVIDGKKVPGLKVSYPKDMQDAIRFKGYKEKINEQSKEFNKEIDTLKKKREKIDKVLYPE